MVVSERTDPTMYCIGKLWGQLCWWAYSSADCIVVQSEGYLVTYVAIILLSVQLKASAGPGLLSAMQVLYGGWCDEACILFRRNG